MRRLSLSRLDVRYLYLFHLKLPCIMTTFELLDICEKQDLQTYNECILGTDEELRMICSLSPIRILAETTNIKMFQFILERFVERCTKLSVFQRYKYRVELRQQEMNFRHTLMVLCQAHNYAGLVILFRVLPEAFLTPKLSLIEQLLVAHQLDALVEDLNMRIIDRTDSFPTEIYST